MVTEMLGVSSALNILTIFLFLVNTVFNMNILWEVSSFKSYQKLHLSGSRALIFFAVKSLW